MALKRRNFLAAGAAAAAAAGCSSTKSPWRTLSDSEAATLDAVCACLIPVDQNPGAREAGVVHFIDRQLTRKFKDMRPDYARWLAALGARNFAGLPAAEQTKLLAALEKGEGDKAAWGPDGGREAFNTVLTHTMMGFYGSPRHGGNREAVSWKMLGVPEAPVRGRLAYNDPGGAA